MSSLQAEVKRYFKARAQFRAARQRLIDIVKEVTKVGHLVLHDVTGTEYGNPMIEIDIEQSLYNRSGKRLKYVINCLWQFELTENGIVVTNGEGKACFDNKYDEFGSALNKEYWEEKRANWQEWANKKWREKTNV